MVGSTVVFPPSPRGPQISPEMLWDILGLKARVLAELLMGREVVETLNLGGCGFQEVYGSLLSAKSLSG